MSSAQFTMHINQFPRVISEFINGGASFQVINDGSSTIVRWQDKSWRFIDYGGVAGHGYHLSKNVIKDAENYILTHKDADKLKKKKEGAIIDNIDLEVQKANMNALQRYEGEQIYCVDISDCYWDTAFKLGFISQTTHLSGLKKKEWKVGRNASIGALAKNVTVVDYIDGIKQAPRRVEPEVDLSPIRDAIVNHVHQMFMELIANMENDWLMYFTDCLYVPYSKREQVIEYFKNLGYQTKESTYHLDSVDTKTGNVVWHDYQKNKAKWFQFSNRQQTLDKFSIIKQFTKIQNNEEFLKEEKSPEKAKIVLHSVTEKNKSKQPQKRAKK